MLRRRELLIVAGVGLAAASAGALLGPLALQSRSGAADLLSASYPDTSGQTRRVSDWRGRIVVVNFWATWCAPCREEMPLLQASQQKYRNKFVQIVGIGIDSAPKIRQFTAEYGILYPILIADSGALELMRKLGNEAGALPYTVILDRDGAIAYRRLGLLKQPDFHKVLDGMLR